MRNPNHIYGRPLRFGDPGQIAYVRELQEIFNGQPFEPEEFHFVGYDKDGDYWYHTDNLNQACQLRALFTCKNHICTQKLCFKKDYQPVPLHYQSLLAPWPDLRCKNCGTRYRMDSDYDLISVINNEITL